MKKGDKLLAFNRTRFDLDRLLTVTLVYPCPFVSTCKKRCYGVNFQVDHEDYNICSIDILVLGDEDDG